MDIPINSTEIVKILRSLSINKRYINNEPVLYIEQMDLLLNAKYGRSFLIPVELIDKNHRILSQDILFANISFPENIRTSNNVPMLDTNNFYTVITDLHNQCHEATKTKLAEMRKKRRNREGRPFT